MEPIKMIVERDSCADERRRTDQEALKIRGFEISRTALYHRLLPRCQIRAEGKWHSNGSSQAHEAIQWWAQTTNDMSTHVSAVKPLKISIDLLHFSVPKEFWRCRSMTKPKFQLVLRLPKFRALIAMSLEWKVRLPDHDSVVATKHKLVPSVSAILTITPDKFSADAVTHSGKFEKVRSGLIATLADSRHMQAASNRTSPISRSQNKSHNTASQSTFKSRNIFCKS